MAENLKTEVRLPQVEGILYSEDPDTLNNQIASWLPVAGCRKKHPASAIQTPVSLICPHGHYPITGPLMANAYNQIADINWSRILIVAGVHREKEKAIFLPPYTSFATPQGEIPLDTAIISAVQDQWELAYFSDTPHLEEHAIELQLPFIHFLFKGTPIIPLLTGNETKEIVKAITEICTWITSKPGKTLLVISSNLTAYQITDITKLQTERLITGMLNQENLLDLYRRKEISPCGVAPIQGVLNYFSDLSADNNDKPAPALDVSLLEKEVHIHGQNGISYGTFILSKQFSIKS